MTQFSLQKDRLSFLSSFYQLQTDFYLSTQLKHVPINGVVIFGNKRHCFGIIILVTTKTYLKQPSLAVIEFIGKVLSIVCECFSRSECEYVLLCKRITMWSSHQSIKWVSNVNVDGKSKLFRLRNKKFEQEGKTKEDDRPQKSCLSIRIPFPPF